jgi:Tol biopolymer transport system component/Ca2+-binding EF-hand superfamily protein
MAFGCGVLVAADAKAIDEQFARLDRDRNQRLSLEEFLQAPGEAPVLKRDFRLFDFNRDEALAPDEFRAMPLGRPALERGPLPDPMTGLVDQAVAQMDAAFGQWDKQPDKKVTPQDFVQSFLLSFPDPSSVGQVKNFYQEADEDQDGRVSHEEARRFLEIQLGVRRGDGNLLRLPNGVVVTNAIYISLDANQDNVIDRDEFLSRWWHKEAIEDQWKLLDRDRNGSITFEEFVHPKWPAGWKDPVEEFRAWDTNLDAFLDPDELLAGTQEWNQRLARHAFPGFDLDRDGKLSLDEFRFLPQSNLVVGFNDLLPDVNRDGALSLAEFAPQEGRFPLLRLMYFSRLDQDGDELLCPKEFTFKRYAPAALFRLNADGTGLKKVFSSEDYSLVGSPKISRDGKWLACDGVEKGDTNGRRVMLLMTIDGQEVRELGEGMMPTWSADGKQIAYSNAGVQVMTLQTRASLILVQNGWGAQWSPDGKRIAYAEASAIKTIDPESSEIETILDENESPYRQIYWNMGWSADNTRLCFKGIRKNGKAEIASVSVVDPPDLKVHYDGERPYSNNFAWSADGKRIVFGMHAENSNRMLMHEFDPTAERAEPKLLAGPDPLLRSDDVCFSPDGRFLIFNGREE